MGSEWLKTTLGETANLKNGKGLKNSFYDDDGKYPVWGANGQIARTDQLLNEQPVVVIGRVGAYCGSIHAVFEPNWVTDNAIQEVRQLPHRNLAVELLRKLLNDEIRTNSRKNVVQARS